MPLFMHLLVDLEHGLRSVWHWFPMKCSLHSHMYLSVAGSNLQMPLFEQFTRHDVTSISDCKILSNFFVFSAVNETKFGFTVKQVVCSWVALWEENN